MLPLTEENSVSAPRSTSLPRRLAVGAVTVVVASGLSVGAASASTTGAHYKSSLGSIFSCQKHHHFYC